MGYIKHHAIVVTGFRWDDGHGLGPDTDIADAHAAAIRAGCLVSPIVDAGINSYASFLVAPDGSKEGWEPSEMGDVARDRFVEWLDAANGPRGGWFAWAEVVLGCDDAEAHIERHAWQPHSAPGTIDCAP